MGDFRISISIHNTVALDKSTSAYTYSYISLGFRRGASSNRSLADYTYIAIGITFAFLRNNAIVFILENAILMAILAGVVLSIIFLIYFI